MKRLRIVASSETVRLRFRMVKRTLSKNA